jgi:hypothetical protein
MKNARYTTLEIVQDDGAGNPREEFDNLSTFYSVRQPREITGGKNDVEFNYRDDLESAIKDLRKAGAVVVEFNQNAGTQYAVVERAEIIQEYGDNSRKARNRARSCAAGEISTWSAWADGEIYGYIVKDLDGEHLDSCWEFYGEKYAREEGESSQSFYEEQAKISQSLIDNRLEEVTK